MLALKSANVLLELDLGTGKELTLPKSVQRDPIRGTIEHVDLIVVKRGEKVVVEVVSTSPAARSTAASSTSSRTTITVEAEATSIPSRSRRPRQGHPGTQVHAGDLVLPAGDVQIEAERSSPTCSSPQVEAEPEVEAEVVDGELRRGRGPADEA